MIDIPGYRIESELGRGGMATVYLAVQESLGRRVALKVLAPQLALSDPGFTQRFLREGRIAASLRHRHIVAIHDVGVHLGHAYMALEYLPSGSLGGGPPMEPGEALRVVHDIALALDLAHRQGIVHRDVKPENILRGEDGYVLSDFGIARLANASQVMTQEGATVGTPAYMAPEQWRNLDVDGRADLYSLGVVLYQLLTGRVPYAGSDGWAIGMQHMQAPLPRLPEPLADLQPLLDRMLAKERSERFASGAAVAAAIAALRAGSGSATPTETLGAAPPAWRSSPAAMARLFDTGAGTSGAGSRLRRRRGAVAGALLAASVLAAGWWWSARDARQFPGVLAATDGLATVAVLPCDSSVNLAELREAGDTLAEELIHRLGRLRALTVVARSSSFPLRDSGLDAKEIGERLGASHLLACSLRRAPEGVRLRAELVETRGGTLQWSAEYERGVEQLLQAVDELALGISEQLLDRLAGPERALLIRHRTGSLEAIRLVRDAATRAQAFTLTSVREARPSVEQAITLAPDYAGAQVAMAILDGMEWQLAQRDAAWWRGQVEPRVVRALEIDPEFAPAFALRGEMRCAEFDWEGCRADVERALALGPGLPEVQAVGAYYHRLLGSRSRAVEHATRRVRIEPESSAAWADLAATLIRADRAAEALVVAERSIERFPRHWTLRRARALALEQLGRCDEGVAAQDRALEVAEDVVEADSGAGSLYVCAGLRERALARLREYERMRASGDAVNEMAFVIYHNALGNRSQALDALEAMFASRDPRLLFVLTNPLYGIEALGGDPRLLALVERLHLPEGAMSWQPGR